MRTLILSANAVPRRGGQGLNLYHMIRGLSRSFQLTVFCGGPCPEAQTHLVPESRASQWIKSIPILRRRRDWHTVLSDIHFDRYVSSRLFSVELFQGAVGQCAESFAAAKPYGCRSVLDVVNTHIDDLAWHVERECQRFRMRTFIHPRMRARIRLEYERADLIRVMSSHAAQTFLERGFAPDRLVVVPPPIEFDKFSPARFAESLFRVIYVGLIEPWKGFHDLVEVFDSLRLPESELVLWGGSGARPITDYLQRRMAQNSSIRIRPVEVERIGYAEVYGKASVLVHPALSEGFGYVVAEAMASGLPVIVTKNTGAAALVTDGENGYVIAAGDRDALRDRLVHLWQNPGLLREMGRAARETVRQLTFEAFRHRYVPRLRALC